MKPGNATLLKPTPQGFLKADHWDYRSAQRLSLAMKRNKRAQLIFMIKGASWDILYTNCL